MYMFSQTRESPEIELVIHERCGGKKYLIVGSGGCTLFSLLSVINSNTMIDVIDMNPAQLYLIQLKLATICYLKEIDKILDFWEGHDDIKNTYSNLILSNECREYWDNHQELLYTGINQNGTFEKLFKELVDTQFDYKKVFNREYLESKFGRDSVINSLNHEFYEHFEKVLKSYDGDIENYFYYQIMNNKYHRDYLPSYFNHLDTIIKNINNINYIQHNIYDYICNTDIKYDVIQTSNITDWMNIGQCRIFIDSIYNLLNNNGVVIMRRLNGDYQLCDLLSSFKILNTPIDKSYFYNETLAAQKI